MEDDLERAPRLGNLAQAARGKQLRQARNLLIVIGVLTLVVNGIMLFLIPKQADEFIKTELARLQGQGMRADPVQVEAARSRVVLVSYALTGSICALGILFIIFGLLVKKFPVPITVTALILYVGAAAGFALLDPATLAQGIILKVIVVIGLIKAIQAAIAYQREQSASDLELEVDDA